MVQPRLYTARNLCSIMLSPRKWLASGDADEVVFLGRYDLDGDDVASAQSLFVAGDEDEGMDVGGVGSGAADEDVLFALDGLIEDAVERAADLLLVAGESNLLLKLHELLAAGLHHVGGHVVGQLGGRRVGLKGIGEDAHP